MGDESRCEKSTSEKEHGKQIWAVKIGEEKMVQSRKTRRIK